MNKGAINILAFVSVDISSHSSKECIASGGTAGSEGRHIYVHVQYTATAFCQSGCINLLITSNENSSSSTSLPILDIARLFYISYCRGMLVSYDISIFFMNNDREHIFVCLFLIWYLIFLIKLLTSFVHLKNWVIFFILIVQCFLF